MAFIRYAGADELDERWTKPFVEDPVDNILRIHSLNPPSFLHHSHLYSHLMRGPSPLTRVQREMIAVTVSAENDCFY